MTLGFFVVYTRVPCRQVMRYIVLTLLMLPGLHRLTAQSMGIGTDTPDPASILELNSTDKGVLIPRMTTVQRDDIPGMAAAQRGMLIYNTTTGNFNFWTGFAWVPFPQAVVHEWTDGGDVLYPADDEDESVAVGTTTISARLSVDQEDFTDALPAFYARRRSNANTSVAIDLEHQMQRGGYGIYNHIHGTTGASSNILYGFYNDLDAVAGSGRVYGQYNDLSTVGSSSSIAAIWTEMINDAVIGPLYGLANEMGGTGAADKLAVYNDFASGAAGRKVGSYNVFRNGVTGNSFGGYTEFETGVSGVKYGHLNRFGANPGGSVFGLYNVVGNMGTDSAVAVYNRFQPNGNTQQATKIGLRNEFPIGTERGSVFGVQNDIQSSGWPLSTTVAVDNTLRRGGTVYGVRNTFEGTGHTAYGIANLVTSESGTFTGLYNEFSSSTGSSGNLYGSRTFYYPDITSPQEKIGHEVLFLNNVSGTKYGYSVEIYDASDSYFVRGLNVDIENADDGFTYGARLQVSGDDDDIVGLFSQVPDASSGSTSNYAGYFVGRVYMVPSLGIGILNPAYYLHLVSNSAAKPASSTWIVTSDARLKNDLGPFDDGLDLLLKMKPVWFEYNGKGGVEKGLKGVGLMAQDLQELAPYMVDSWTHYPDSADLSKQEEYLAIDYGAMDFILMNAIREQQAAIEANAMLREENERLTRQVLSLDRRLTELEGLVETLMDKEQ